MRYLLRSMAVNPVRLLLLSGLRGLARWRIPFLCVERPTVTSRFGQGASTGAKGFVLVDVRSPEEHASGMIPGTDLNIDFREMKARHRELGAKLDDHIVVYCQSGHRSNIAAETLADLGYTHVYNVVGSMNAWTEAGFPVAPVR